MKKLLALGGLVVVVLVAVGCSNGSGSPSSGPSVGANAVSIAAKDVAFSTKSLTAPAGTPFQIAFDNQESAPHNVAIYRDASAAEKVFGEAPFGGPKVVVYNVPALAAGSYFFRCDVHPDMSGNLTVK